MIRYTLECACGEGFEAWFRNAQSCDQQLASGAVACPVCAGVDVSKALMAPSVAQKTEAPQPTGSPPPSSTHAAESAAPPAPGGAASEQARYAAFQTRAIEQKLRALRAHVEATAESVGRDFAKEARAIHEGEAEERPIYGEATRDEAEALLEDGVPVAPIPWIDKTDD